ncbi:MAG TPA: hypothetical protein VLZ28_08615 [Daejeonella sp.]|nr:hypothetical protein [Daejeonella sp.]
MSDLLSQNQAALKMLFTEDIYLVKEEEQDITVKPDKVEPVVEPEVTIQPEISASPKTDFEYLGDNNKYFLILIEDMIHTRMNPAHQEMLLKIMGAKKLELRDLAILNINRYPEIKFDALKDFFSCNRVVMFGITPSQIGLPPAGINKVNSAGTVKLLPTYSLEEMRNNDDKKREFWTVMKNF